ncbi:hypothetical protein C8Q73DRAFT_796208 [Cubamyces lactineus]|nr:hypothetical protein C8Q73DRAFT_796208 [Cubamyces lactineus]
MLTPHAPFLLLLLGIVPVVIGAVASGLENNSFARQEHSLPCAAPDVSGIMQVLSLDPDQDDGNMYFVSCSFFGRDSQCLVTEDRSDAHRVVLRRNCDPAGSFSVELSPPSGAKLFFGAAVFTFLRYPSSNAKDLAPDSYNSAKIEPTVLVPRGPAQDKRRRGLPKAIESTIWTLQNDTGVDSSDMTLVPSWVNINGSVVSNVSLVFIPDEHSLALTGNGENLEERFGLSSRAVTIRFIPETGASEE